MSQLDLEDLSQLTFFLCDEDGIQTPSAKLQFSAHILYVYSATDITEFEIYNHVQTKTTRLLLQIHHFAIISIFDALIYLLVTSEILHL
jgi:hypothetical protein